MGLLYEFFAAEDDETAPGIPDGQIAPTWATRLQADAWSNMIDLREEMR
jgi:hypothetical protein